MQVQPYLFFEGRCDEALAFYRTALGAEVTMLMRYSDLPPDQPASAPADKVMHAAVRIGETVVLASDGHCGGSSNFQGFSLSLTLASVAEAERVFAALGEGGQIRMPLTATFFSPGFGTLTDRFGMTWMVMADPAPPAG